MNEVTRNQIIVYVAFAIMIGINIFVNVFQLNGYTTGEVSDLHEIYFTPASYTFSIWTVIYLGLLIWLLTFTMRKQQITQTIVWTFVVTCFWNIAWLIAWHYLFFGVAAIILVLHLVSVFFLYLLQRRIEISNWYHYPISLYLGWLIVAVTVNILYFLVATVGVQEVAELSYTYLAICILVIFAILQFFIWKDWVIQLVLIWAFIGIIVKNYHDNWVLSFILFLLTVGIAALSYFWYKRARAKQKLK